MFNNGFAKLNVEKSYQHHHQTAASKKEKKDDVLTRASVGNLTEEQHEQLKT